MAKPESRKIPPPHPPGTTRAIRAHRLSRPARRDLAEVSRVVPAREQLRVLRLDNVVQSTPKQEERHRQVTDCYIL